MKNTFSTSPRWESQHYPPEGATAAEGIRNQLGRPALDLLTILVREAAQNSWDARSERTDSVRFGLDLHTVSPAHAHAWRSLLLEGGPHDADHFPLRGTLNRPAIRVLAVSDRGTKGLGGPTRADVVTDNARDFVTFVRNAGEPRDVKLGGGTYGFGKGIFYMLSRAHTVLVHTRTEHEGRLQTRLIGIALAKSYTQQGPTGATRFTGRHWWGAPTGDVVEPLVDAEAEAGAEALGLQPFGPDETGTTVVVVDPNVEDALDTSEAVGQYLAETILWQLWPKILPRTDHLPSMEFDVVVDGQRYEVPDPATTHPVSLFVEAYRRMQSDDARLLELGRPKRLLGRLGLNDTLVFPWTVTRAAESAGFEDNLVHHTCLMRAAELVVTYIPGVRPAAELKGYAGVFRAEDDLDDLFAKAEPPTHDAWNPDSLPPEERRYVKGVFNRLREAEKEVSGLRVVVGSGTGGVALGAASNYFSDLMRGTTGFGGRSAPFRNSALSPQAAPADTAGAGPSGTRPSRPGVPPHGSTGAGNGAGSWSGLARGPGDDQGAGARKRVRIEYVDAPRLDHDGVGPVVVQEFRMSTDNTVRLDARLSIAVAMDASRRDADHTDPPRVLDWISPDGTVTRETSPALAGSSEGTWQLRVRPPRDTMIVVDVVAEAMPG